MASKTTTYMVKGTQRERFKTEGLATIPGVEVRNKRGGTDQLPYAKPEPEPEPEYTAPRTRTNDAESQRPTLGVGTQAPASEDITMPGTRLPFESDDELTLAPEDAQFETPWSSPTPAPAAAPPAAHTRPTARQLYLLVSFEAGSEPVNLPGLHNPAHLPIVRIESTHTSYDAAYSRAASLNRDQASRGRVYAVNAVNIPL